MTSDSQTSAAPDESWRDEAPLDVTRFIGLRPGPKLLVTGAVHGNEPCGPVGIARAISDIRAGRLLIRRGEVSFLPVANQKAFRQKTREGDRNLNRDLGEKLLPLDYEDRIGAPIAALLRSHEILLDLHSFRSPAEPFVFCGPRDNIGDVEPFRHGDAEWSFATTLGVDLVIHGWLDAYAIYLTRRAALGHLTRGMAEGFGTTEYMRFSGGYGVTLECGQHDDPVSGDIAYRGILNALAHLGLIDAPAPARSATTAIELVDALVCDAKGDKLAKNWRTGDAVKSGETIIARAGGAVVAAAEDGYLVFPNPAAEPGELMAYVGVKSARLR